MSKHKTVLSAYLFHFNTYTNKWAAFKRDDKDAYFGKADRSKQNNILYADDIMTLVEFINK